MRDLNLEELNAVSGGLNLIEEAEKALEKLVDHAKEALSDISAAIVDAFMPDHYENGPQGQEATWCPQGSMYQETDGQPGCVAIPSTGG